MTLRRIVVGLDPRPQERAALEAAVRLASGLHAELVGLFVEDIDLLRLAALPFAREIGFPSAAMRTLDIGMMERSLRALADEMQRTLAAIAARGPVPWSFRITRGALMSELRAAAATGDIVVTGALRLSLPAPLSVLCSAATPPEVVVPAAAALARSTGRRVEIVLLDGEEAQKWGVAAGELIAAEGGGLRLRTAHATSGQSATRGGPIRGDR